MPGSGSRHGQRSQTSSTPKCSVPAGATPLRTELGIPLDGLVVLAAAAIKRDHKRIDYLLDEFAAVAEDGPGPSGLARGCGRA